MRTVGSTRETTWPVIRAAGIELLYEHGFEAMNLRQLAKAAGLGGGGSLYNYFASKEEFLFRLMCEIMEEILGEIERYVDAGAAPAERLKSFVKFHIEWHTQRRKETFISHMEMRSLPSKRYKAYVQLRKRYEEHFIRIVEDGCKSGDFMVSSPHLVTQSVLSMLTSVCYWYRSDGPIGLDRLIEEHARMVIAILTFGTKSSARPR
jgi:AcrR family transcriptional regulator